MHRPGPFVGTYPAGGEPAGPTRRTGTASRPRQLHRPAGPGGLRRRRRREKRRPRSARSLGRTPTGGDDRIELGSQQILVRADQGEELLVHRRRAAKQPGRGHTIDQPDHHPSPSCPEIATDSGVDRLTTVAGLRLSTGGLRAGLRDLDPAGLGLLRHRDPQGEHAGVVTSLDAFGVQVVAQDQLPAEDLAWAFGCDNS